MAKLSPLLSQAAALSNSIGRIALSSGINALDAVRQPAIAIDRFGQVLETSNEADALFDEDLCVKQGRLFLSDPEAGAKLERLQARLRVATAFDDVADNESVFVRRRSGRNVILRMLEVPPAARDPFFGARAIIAFSRLAPVSEVDWTALSDAYALTAAEVRLATALAKGRSISVAAGELGIARDTARKRLQSLFLKTGTHRQSELIALLSRLPAWR